MHTMIRIVGFFLVAGALIACAHESDRAGTTTVTSASSRTDGVRVTNVSAADYDPAERLAGELCRREATCGRIEARSSDEAKLLGEQNCVTSETPRIRKVMNEWPCSQIALPRSARFEECLAAVRSDRCETNLSSPDTLAACRGKAVCGS